MLTQLAISAAKPKDKSYKLSDSDGLALLVEAGGSKLWRFRFHFSGKERMLSLGSYPDVSLAQARAKRDEARKLLAAGQDPSQKRREEKAAAAVAAANTFGVLAAEYIDKLEKETAARACVFDELANNSSDRRILPECEAAQHAVLALINSHLHLLFFDHAQMVTR